VNAPDCSVGPAAPTDLAVLLAVERLSSPHPWSEGLLKAALAGAAGESAHVVRRPDTGAPIGFCISRLAADEVEIHNVAVHPTHRRRGLARRLLTTALDDAARGGATTAHLDVRASNSAAIALYLGLGFQPAGRRRDYYASPTEDALLLSVALPLPRPGEVLPVDRTEPPVLT
jgi:[ribosomal protein S18]-alanine N-acetyltransferase